MDAYCSHAFPLPLPPGHRFPMSKYSMLHGEVEAVAAASGIELREAPAATDGQLRAAHTQDYVRRVLHGELDPVEIRRLGFPWSPELVERSRRSVGATLAACRAALRHGRAVSLAGGTHHAFADRGEGYCVFNDSVIAARALRAEGMARRVLVLDADVHQGNGTAALAAGDPDLFAFSIHGRHNFPFRKERGDLDVELEDGTGDEAYLAALAAGVEEVLARFHPDLVIYLAGADPFAGDRLGRLALTRQGLARRDRWVLDLCRRHAWPVAVTMAGGYADPIADTVAIHLRTVLLAAGARD